MSDSSGNQEIEEPAESRETRDLTISDAYVLGSHLTYLKYSEKSEPHIGSVERGGILHSLEVIQNRLIATDTALTVASQAENMKKIIHQEHGNDFDSTTELNGDIARHLSQKADTWDHLLSEKLAKEHRINIPSTGFLDFEELMHYPDAIFEGEVWEELDEDPKNDIAEACRCLPMGCSTASVMVSLRGVEHYLRKWYKNETGKDLERGTWGSVLDDLMERYVAEEDMGGPVLQQLSSVPGVLSNLHYLKEKRDKVSHPDESPSSYEAIITLFMVAGTISEVCREIGEIPEASHEFE